MTHVTREKRHCTDLEKKKKKRRLTFMISSNRAAFTSRSLNWQMYPELKIGSYEDKKATLKQISGISKNAHRRTRPIQLQE